MTSTFFICNLLILLIIPGIIHGLLPICVIFLVIGEKNVGGLWGSKVCVLFAAIHLNNRKTNSKYPALVKTIAQITVTYGTHLGSILLLLL